MGHREQPRPLVGTALSGAFGRLASTLRCFSGMSAHLGYFSSSIKAKALGIVRETAKPTLNVSRALFACFCC